MVSKWQNNIVAKHMPATRNGPHVGLWPPRVRFRCSPKALHLSRFWHVRVRFRPPVWKEDDLTLRGRLRPLRQGCTPNQTRPPKVFFAAENIRQKRATFQWAKGAPLTFQDRSGRHPLMSPLARGERSVMYWEKCGRARKKPDLALWKSDAPFFKTKF